MHPFMTIESVRQIAKKSKVITFCYRALNDIYRRSRRSFLMRKHPDGSFLACNGEKIFCDFHDPNYYWYDGDSDSLIFEKELVVDLMKQSQGEVYIDIGAHNGFFSSCMATALYGQPGTILSIEPDASVADCLKRTLSQFDTENFPEVILLNCAVGAENKFITAYKSESMACLHTYNDGDTTYFSTTVEVRSLDSIVDEVVPEKKVAFIKLDVDGSEPDVIRGCQKIITEFEPIIFIEFAPWCLEGAKKDPQMFYSELHEMFNYVYWHSFQLNGLERVNVHDYQRIHEVTGDCVTNLVLSNKKLAL